MIQAVALLAMGAAAVGLWLADGFGLLLSCWVVVSTLHAGLVAARGLPQLRAAAREVFLVDMFGSWVLVMGGLSHVLASGARGVPGALTTPEGNLAWVGLGLLLVTMARLGLPPLVPWQTHLAAAPPAVRIFVHAALYPLTALILWQRLDAWLVPWQLQTAAWLGAVVALLTTTAAAGERVEPRRAALLGTGCWAALLTLTAADALPNTSLLLAATGLALVYLVAATPRWSRAWRRALLAIGAVTLAVAVSPPLVPLVTETRVPLMAVVLAQLAAVPAVIVMIHWWLTMAPQAATAERPQRRLLPQLTGLARLVRGPGPVFWLAGAVGTGLSRLAAGLDRIVLGGVVEGLALMAVGAGWLMAWIDRRFLDAVEHGLGSVCLAIGRASREGAGGGAPRVVFWSVVVLVALLLGVQLWS